MSAGCPSSFHKKMMLPFVYEHLTSERLGSLSFQLPEEALVHIAIDKEVKVPDQCPDDIPFADAVALALPQGLRPDLKADATHRLMTLRCELECDQAALKPSTTWSARRICSMLPAKTISSARRNSRSTRTRSPQSTRSDSRKPVLGPRIDRLTLQIILLFW